MTTWTRARRAGALGFCLVCASNVTASAQVSANADTVALDVAKPIERPMKGGESQSYSIRLDPWQYLSLVVEQKGVDVVVRLFDPSGAKLREVDSPNGTAGPEPLSCVTEPAGTYRVEVAALEAGAAAGAYQIQVLELRAATDTERTLIEPRALDAQATQLSVAGNYHDAIPIAERAFALTEKALGPDNLEVATAADKLAELYRNQAQYAKAEPLYTRALAIREKSLGPDHPDVAAILNDLAFFYYDTGQYPKAEQLYVRALAIQEKALGPDNPSLARILTNLGEVYFLRKQYEKAEPLFVRAIAIREKAFGPNGPDLAGSLTGLAKVYSETGQYAKSEPLYTRALAIEEKAYGPDHPFVATDLNNLGAFYSVTKQYEKAEPLYTRALAIYEKTLGPEHPNVGIALLNLAVIYSYMKEYAKAEPLYAREIALFEKAEGLEHPDVAYGVHSLASLYIVTGQYAKAEPLFLRAIAINEKAYGPEHPAVATSLGQLAIVRMGLSDLNGALRYQARSGEVREAELRHNLTAGSAEAKRVYLEQTLTEFYRTLSMQAASPSTDTDALRIALTQVLRRKGRALDALVDQLDVLARSGTADDRKLLDELAHARADYAAATLRGAGAEGSEQHRRNLADAAARVDDLEAKASAQSSRVRAELTPITLDGVRKAVPAGATLVEFATYRPYDVKAQSNGPTRYVAYTLTADGTIRWADLGAAEQIEKAVAAFRDTLRSRGDVKPSARALDALIFAPVRALVGASTRLFIAPDGQLSLVPFDALVDEKGRYAIETYEISYLTSGRDLLRLTARGESRQPAAVFANPDFGAAGAPGTGGPEGRAIVHEANATTSGSAAGVLAVAFFRPLPGTATEADVLRGLLPGARVLTGAAASKQAVRALAGPRVLHLATHGFFLAAAQSSADDPLLRSGLAFAGANRHEGGDSILTSMEAAGLDLWGTKLVVLSACDTGLGEVRNGDGVYGLRRALVLAGSETQVMSLWPVSDQGTRDLMIGYYRRLAAGGGRSAALREARLAMLKDPKRRHPYYWASFIVSGEWANLDGKRR